MFPGRWPSCTSLSCETGLAFRPEVADYDGLLVRRGADELELAREPGAEHGHVARFGRHVERSVQAEAEGLGDGGSAGSSTGTSSRAASARAGRADLNRTTSRTGDAGRP